MKAYINGKLKDLEDWNQRKEKDGFVKEQRKRERQRDGGEAEIWISEQQKQGRSS